ncbi:MAG TPA: 2-C-methyl-D-erythritol 4-phosphate cytidylyltransferase [Streptosporangiaceae bacterium]|nr:2-C-methyl-D-erythritol 4-phosphate cytidylyltransferase [Streptosporangiaceae bacterium]
MRTVAVVLAGGSGSRFGGSMPKQHRLLAGRSLLEHCVAAFDQAPAVDDVLVVTPAGRTAATAADLREYGKLSAVVAGGTARSDSTRQAIAAIAAAAAADCNVLFHDAARPLVDQRIIADCVTALGTWQAVGVVVPTADTIVETDGTVLGRVLPRATLARCQTPQGFRLSVIARAYELAAADPGFAAVSATDDCGVVRRYLPDIPIGAVPGSERNLKVTYPGDLAVAEALLREPGPGAPA